MVIAIRLAGEEAYTLGRLTIVAARMNPDLAMGDELLKKTGSSRSNRPTMAD